MKLEFPWYVLVGGDGSGEEGWGEGTWPTAVAWVGTASASSRRSCSEGTLRPWGSVALNPCLVSKYPLPTRKTRLPGHQEADGRVYIPPA